MTKPKLVSTAENTSIKTGAIGTTSSGDPLTPNILKPVEEKQSCSAGGITRELPETKNLNKNSEQSLISGNLSEEIVKQCEKAKKIIFNANQFSDLLDPLSLFKTAERLIAFQSWIISELLKSESRYREKRAEHIRSGGTAAAAEAEAKTSPEYRAYRYLDFVYTIAENQINLIKKFSDKLQAEFKNQ